MNNQDNIKKINVTKNLEGSSVVERCLACFMKTQVSIPAQENKRAMKNYQASQMLKSIIKPEKLMYQYLFIVLMHKQISQQDLIEGIEINMSIKKLNI